MQNKILCDLFIVTISIQPVSTGGYLLPFTICNFTISESSSSMFSLKQIKYGGDWHGIGFSGNIMYLSV
jgi:hypothetical protein